MDKTPRVLNANDAFSIMHNDDDTATVYIHLDLVGADADGLMWVACVVMQEMMELIADQKVMPYLMLRAKEMAIREMIGHNPDTKEKRTIER